MDVIWSLSWQGEVTANSDMGMTEWKGSGPHLKQDSPGQPLVAEFQKKLFHIASSSIVL